MSTLNRSTFLSRVTAAVRAGNLYREHRPRELPAQAGYVGAGDDPVGQLVHELETVGVHAHRAENGSAAHAVIRRLVEQHSIRSAIRNAGGLIDEVGVDDLLRSAGVRVWTMSELAGMGEPARRDAVFAVDLGIAAPDWAIAETGTLVYASGPEQTRSATLLPPVHLAIVERSRILPDLFDLTERLAERAVDGVIPRNVAMITGPSKTGDIELRLTTGVHGPGEVHVLIWEGRKSKHECLKNVEARIPNAAASHDDV